MLKIFTEKRKENKSLIFFAAQRLKKLVRQPLSISKMLPRFSGEQRAVEPRKKVNTSYVFLLKDSAKILQIKKKIVGFHFTNTAKVPYKPPNLQSETLSAIVNAVYLPIVTNAQVSFFNQII
jgi:hypothetical protein